MVLEDNIFENMTLQSFNNGIRPKVHGSWNLHEASLEQPLDFFIVLGSALGQVGNPSQTNYTAGNAYQDALVHYRVSHGLPATVLDLGMMLGVGWVAGDESGLAQRNLEQKGFVGIDESEFLGLFEFALDSCQTQDRCQLVTGIKTRDTGDDVIWKSDPMFSHLKKMDVRTVKDSVVTLSKSAHELLQGVVSLGEAGTVISGLLLQRLSRALMIEASELDINRSPSDYGLDSLIAVELRNWFMKEIKADLPVFEILQAQSFQDLSLLAAEKSTLIDLEKNKS